MEQGLFIMDYDSILFLLRNCRGIVYTAGNGGSASTASHFTQDLVKTCRIKSICLTDNIPYITAVSNDDSYNNIFKDFMDLFWDAKDLLFLISGSGNSKNLVNVAEAMYGKVKTIALVGYDGGKLKQICDYCIHVPIHDMRKAENEQFRILHTLVADLSYESLFHI